MRSVAPIRDSGRAWRVVEDCSMYEQVRMASLPRHEEVAHCHSVVPMLGTESLLLVCYEIGFIKTNYQIITHM